MALQLIGEIELAGATFSVRWIPQRRRDEIIEQAKTRLPGSLATETDPRKYADLIAAESITRWTGLTPLGALELGYEDFEALPVDANGEVPFNVETAKKLYRECLYADFAARIDEVSRNLAREVAREKKRVAASSATSPAPSA